MLSKLLITLAVIAGCLWFLSTKRGAEERPLRVVVSAKEKQRRTMLRRGAYVFMFIMVLAAAVTLSFEWSDNYSTVTVHVVNAQTGLKTTYQARRQDIEQGSFTTLDGRKIFVAGVERIEVEQP